MHERVDPPVEEAVFGLETANPKRTGEVVPPAAPIRPGEAAQTRILVGGVALSTPLRPGDAEDVGKVALVPVRRKKISIFHFR